MIWGRGVDIIYEQYLIRRASSNLGVFAEKDSAKITRTLTESKIKLCQNKYNIFGSSTFNEKKIARFFGKHPLY